MKERQKLKEAKWILELDMQSDSTVVYVSSRSEENKEAVDQRQTERPNFLLALNRSNSRLSLIDIRTPEDRQPWIWLVTNRYPIKIFIASCDDLDAMTGDLWAVVKVEVCNSPKYFSSI